MTDVKALRKAAERGDPQAMVNLGTLAYKAGDLQAAESWYQKAADLGDTNAVFKLRLTRRAHEEPERQRAREARSAVKEFFMYFLGAAALLVPMAGGAILLLLSLLGIDLDGISDTVFVIVWLGASAGFAYWGVGYHSTSHK